MYKDIVFLDGIDDDYKRSVINFVTEWESYTSVIKVSTSGTTGTPKTIEFSKKQAEASARYTGRFFDFKRDEAVLLNLSPDFVAGKLMIVRAMVHEMILVVAPLKSDPFENFKDLPVKIKLGAFVPYQVDAILQNDHSKRIYENIENVIIGGAAIRSDLETKVKALQNKNFAAFGMTETLTHFALRAIDGKTDFYTCLPGIKIEQDDRGCLVVEPNEIVQQRLVTNDVIEKTDAQTFKWIGRFDNMINSGGVKIFPEVDEQLIRHLIKSRFYITSKKNDKLGEEPILVIEDTGENMDEDNLLKQIARILPKYHAPKLLTVMRQFEETANGKMKRTKF